MELFVLGLVLGVGGAKRKAVTKAVAKGYMAVTEKTRTVTSAMREDMRDAVEEARAESDHNDEMPVSTEEVDEEFVALHEETISPDSGAASNPAVGAIGATGKSRGSLLKSLARGYVKVTEHARLGAAGLREEMRDAIEEARYEREQAGLHVETATAKTEVSIDGDPVEVLEAENAGPAEADSVEKVTELSGNQNSRRRTSQATVTTVTTVAPTKATKAVKTTTQAAGRTSTSKRSRNSAASVDVLLEAAEIAAEAAL